MGGDGDAPPPDQGLAGASEDDGGTVVGEWRHVENILTIGRDEGGLLLWAETARASLRLERDGPGRWRAAEAAGAAEPIYEIACNGKSSLQVKKGATAFTVHRVAQSRSLPGRWRRGDKTVVVSPGAAGHGLEMRAAGAALPLLRRGLMEWEARRAEGGEPVYVLEHQEGADEVTVRPPQGPGGSSVTFRRCSGEDPSGEAECDAMALLDAPAGAPRPPQEAGAAAADRERERGSRGCSSSSSRSRGRGRSRSRSGSRGRGELEDFVRRNSLAKRTESALRALTPNELRDVMTPMQGSVRDPDAVVMSRITKVKAELSRGDKKRSTSRGEGGAQEETLEEFVSTNKLCKRIEEELLKLTKAQQGTVMGTDGGRNGFVLLGVVRDPDAVVLSRINRVKADAAGGTRAAAAAPARRDQRRGRSRSYSDYYDDYSYTPSPEVKRKRKRRHEKKAREKKPRKEKKEHRHGKERRRRKR